MNAVMPSCSVCHRQSIGLSFREFSYCSMECMNAGWRSPGKLVNPDITNHIEFYIHDKKLPELKDFTLSQAQALIQFILEVYQGECRGIMGIPSGGYVFTPRLNEAEYMAKCLEVVDVELELGDNVHLIVKEFERLCSSDIPF